MPLRENLYKVVFFFPEPRQLPGIPVMLYFDMRLWLLGFILIFHCDKKVMYFYQKHPYKFPYIASPLLRCNLVGFVGILYFLLLRGRKKDIIHTHV